MEAKYSSLRNLVYKFKSHPEFKRRIATCIFRWAKDQSLELHEFNFLIKKALAYTRN